MHAASGPWGWPRLNPNNQARLSIRPVVVACPGLHYVWLAVALPRSIEGGMVLSQARKDMDSLRIAVEAGLSQVRAWRS